MELSSTRFFNDAFRELQRAMAAFDDPFFHVGPGNTLLGSSSGRDNSMLSPFTSHRHLTGPIDQQQSGLVRYPATNIDETADTYQVSAELPGYDKKDIKIEVGDDNRTLVLSGSVDHRYEQKSSNDVPIQEGGTSAEKKPKQHQQGGGQQQVMKKDQEGGRVQQYRPGQHWWVNERVSGSFSRTFQFPTPIDTSNIKANYQDGVLKVTVPKSKDKKAGRQIDID